MKKLLAALLSANPLACVLVFALLGAVSIVVGVALLAGAGCAFIASGLFLIASAAFLTKGISPNG